MVSVIDCHMELQVPGLISSTSTFLGSRCECLRHALHSFASPFAPCAGRLSPSVVQIGPFQSGSVAGCPRIM